MCLLGVASFFAVPSVRVSESLFYRALSVVKGFNRPMYIQYMEGVAFQLFCV